MKFNDTVPSDTIPPHDPTLVKLAAVLAKLRAVAAKGDEAVATKVDSLLSVIHELKQALGPEFTEVFKRFNGQKFATVAEKREVAGAVNCLLNTTGLSIKCPKTGQPSRMEVKSGSAVPNGMFQLEHRGTSRYVGLSSVSFPELVIIPSEPDGRSSFRSESYVEKLGKKFDRDRD